MSIEIMNPAQLLGVNKYQVDHDEAHIIVNKEACALCQDKPCLVVCPASLFKLDQRGELSFDYAGCLECGTCRMICAQKGIEKWTYPRGTFGVVYRYG